MPQETRKDPRAKVLTMTVRYKSANLDEFIEHHSHDVSRGGMFIKTPSPFPAGTLLKFEVRISADQRVMQGVGRVVWKRDAAESQDAQPPGMGVKFIKIDEASRAVIDQLVAKAGGAPTAFDRGGEGASVAAAAPAATAPAPGPAPRPVASDPPKQTAGRKGTMIGLGAVTAEATKAPEPEPDEEPTKAFFPETKSEEELPPPEDRTVMKQAAELLQDALREAGGSMDEIGSTTSPAKTEAKPAESTAPAGAKPSGKEPVSSKPAAKEPVKTKPAEPKPAAPKPAAAKAAAPASAKPRSEPPRRVSIPAEDGTEGGSGGSKTMVVLLAVAAVAVVAFLLLRGQKPDAPPPEAAQPEAPAAVEPPPPAPEPTPPPAETAPAAVEPEASAAPAATSAAPAATTAPAPAPVETAKPVAPKPAAPKPAAPKPAATPAETAPAATPAAPAEVKPAEPKPAEPKPAAPKPAPKKPADEGDNPY
jgi:uncharacterized protein (TIGR02266 family)